MLHPVTAIIYDQHNDITPAFGADYGQKEVNRMDNKDFSYEKPTISVQTSDLTAEEAYSAAAVPAAAPAVQPVVTAGAAVGAAAFTKYCW